MNPAALEGAFPGDTERLPPDEVVEGGPFQRGLAHGRAHGDLIRECIRRYGGHPDASPQQISSLIAAVATNVRRHYPDTLEEMRGIAAGSDLDEQTIFALNFVEEIWARTGGWPAHIGCSNFATTLPELGPILAHTSDVADGDSPLFVLTQSAPDQGEPYLWLRYAGTLWSAGGVNNAGVTVAGSSIQGSDVDETGLPAFLFGTVALADTRSTAEAAALARHYRAYTGGANTIIVDETGDAALIELVGGRQAKVTGRAGHGEWLACTNHPLDGNARGIASDKQWMSNSIGRLELMSTALRRGMGNLNDVFAILKTHGASVAPGDPGVTSGRGLCQHGDKDLHTEAAVVAAPRRRVLWITRGRTCEQSFTAYSLT